MEITRTVTVKLSPMELTVLKHIARGLTDKEIAAVLNTNPRMIKYYAQKLHLKVGDVFQSPRVSLVIWAYENGIVRVGDNK